MNNGNLTKLRNSRFFVAYQLLALEKLKNERDQITDQFLREKENLVLYEKEMEELRAEEEYLQGAVVEKQESLTEMEQMIAESENAYNRVT